MGLRLLSAWCLAAVVIAGNAAGCAAAPVAANEPVDLKIKPGWRMTFLPEEWKGVHGYFVLDTGCSETAVSEKRFTGLDRQFPGLLPLVFPWWIPPSDSLKPPRLQVGPFRLASLEGVIPFDTTPVSQATGVEIFGLLGGDCLAAKIARFDFDAGKVSIFPARTPPAPEWGPPTPCRKLGNLFYVDVKIGGETVTCLIDTGCTSSLVLPEAVFARATNEARTRSCVSATATGMEQNRTAIVPRIELFGETVTDVAVRTTPETFGLIGLGLLWRFEVTLDYPRGQIHARQAGSFGQADRSKSLGISLVRRNGSVLVWFVEPGGAADRARVKVGDAVLCVNERPVDTFEFLDEIGDAFPIGHPECRLAAVRDGHRLDFAFPPQ